MEEGDIVYDRNGKIRGVLTGNEEACDMEDCGGWCVEVEWSDGEVSWPCENGMRLREDGCYQLI